MLRNNRDYMVGNFIAYEIKIDESIEEGDIYFADKTDGVYRLHLYSGQYKKTEMPIQAAVNIALQEYENLYGSNSEPIMIMSSATASELSNS